MLFRKSVRKAGEDTSLVFVVLDHVLKYKIRYYQRSKATKSKPQSGGTTQTAALLPQEVSILARLLLFFLTEVKQDN